MRLRRIQDDHGFTLVEVLLAGAILAIAGTIALQVVSNAVTSSSITKVMQETTEDARNLMQVVTNDLREAGFGVFLGDLSNVSVNTYFEHAFESKNGATETASDGITVRALKMGGSIRSDMPPSSSELKVDDVEAFLPYDDGYAIVYQNGEFQVLQISKVQDSALMIQHNKDKTKWLIPAGSPVFRVDQIEWLPEEGDRVKRIVNKSDLTTGKTTHEFSNVTLLKFTYVMRDGTVKDSLDGNDALNLMCINVFIDVYRVGGREGKKYHAQLEQTVAPRNL
ncbi:MAG TPA: hypothetical protein DHD79_07600 [Firmicutes bacterium]|jgi:prepilin-type N-terminal cleavage/methylation domain-containing protein|nr:hypothetical protein [Bacillota bacterium]HAZ22473.1 hypothetical protein [Bacillota bacterium]HBE06274.1 hypothetical protein [Bacillota bacterium]HBL50775.1 hypothetical protein [Bacillota bacterium]HCX71092.1 hypothetical protein [Bacillota bacterium]